MMLKNIMIMNNRDQKTGAVIGYCPDSERNGITSSPDGEEAITTSRPTQEEEERGRSASRAGSPDSDIEFIDVEPWPEPVDGNVLLDEIRDELKRFVVLPPWAAEILALMAVHTY